MGRDLLKIQSVFLVILCLFICSILFLGCVDQTNDSYSPSTMDPEEQLKNVLQRYNEISENDVVIPPSDQLGSSWYVLYQTSDFRVSTRIQEENFQVLQRYRDSSQTQAISYAKDFSLAFDSTIKEDEVFEGLHRLITQHDGRGNTDKLGNISFSYTKVVLCNGDWEYDILMSFPKVYYD